jgi:CheY-like chemotaxis protein
MPEMDGIETVERIRRDQGGDAIPVIVMVSAFGSEDVRLKARELDVKDFLAKPFHPQRLYRTICGAMGYASEMLPGYDKIEDEMAENLSSLCGMRILVVEDHAINRLFAKEILKNAGAIAEFAVNGQEAVDAVRKADIPFDAVLMDIQMPVMDGFEATREIRKIPGSETLPIIAMTAHAMTEDKERCMQAGMNAHLAKPIDVMELHSTLLRFGKATHLGAESIKRVRRAELKTTEIPGIDLQDALERLGFNQKLFNRVLSEFLEEKKLFSSEVRTAIAAGSWGDAVLKAHGLKGIAGNLSARRLYGIAIDLETSIEERNSQGAEKLLSELEAAFEEIRQGCAMLDGGLTQFRSSDIGKLSDSASLHLVGELFQSLKLQDLQASGQIEALKEIVGNGPAQRTLHAIDKKIRKLDFIKALPLLYILADELGVSLEDKT